MLKNIFCQSIGSHILYFAYTVTEDTISTSLSQASQIFSGLGIRSFPFFTKERSSLRSFPFFKKERGVLCVLSGFKSHTKIANLAKKRTEFFAFFSVL